MNSAQNLIYAVIQVVHNYGAIAVVGGSLMGFWLHEKSTRKKLAFLTLLGWMTQVASGATFGMATFYYHHQLPDISGIAIVALGIKMLCATLGILILAIYLWRSEHWAEQGRNTVWITSSTLAISALSSAAFLRWFS
ncbi:MAG: hypothetical protein WAW02_10310 [Sideroxyarcus sp.]